MKRNLIDLDPMIVPKNEISRYQFFHQPMEEMAVKRLNFNLLRRQSRFVYGISDNSGSGIGNIPSTQGELKKV